MDGFLLLMIIGLAFAFYYEITRLHKNINTLEDEIQKLEGQLTPIQKSNFWSRHYK